MSVQTEYMMIYGVKGNYDDFYYMKDNEELNIPDYWTDTKFISGKLEPIIVCDDMCGEFSTFGILVERGGRKIDYEEDLEISISISELTDIHNKFMKYVSDNNINLKGYEPKLHIFKMYS